MIRVPVSDFTVHLGRSFSQTLWPLVAGSPERAGVVVGDLSSHLEGHAITIV